MAETPPIHAQDLQTHFSHYLGILLRRRWLVLAVFLIVFLLSALYAFRTRPVFQAKALINIERLDTRASPSVAATEENQDEEYFQTQYKLITSDNLIQRVYASLRLEKTEDFAEPQGMQKLQKAVTVASIPRTRLAYVQAESHDPDLALRVANTLVDYFVEQNLNNQLFMSKEVLQALQLKKSGDEMRRTVEALPAVVDNHMIQTIKEQIFTLEAQVADLSIRYTPSHPTLVATKSRLESLRRVYQTELDNIVRSLKTQLSGELQANNVRIVDRAKRPDLPARPNKPLVLLLGLLAGMVAGVFAAALAEVLDQTIRSQDDVEIRLGQRFLGLVPVSSRKKKDSKVYAPLLSPDPSLDSEAFRNLRTMVDLGGQDKTSSLLVTSTLQEEGKSFVAANLSVAFAQLGEKVLLLEGDLRRPRAHHNLGVPSERGLSDFLQSDAKPDAAMEFIQPTDVPGLFILPCGPRPPNPSELLNTARLGVLLTWARFRFTRIVVDCTPMFPISDTLLWGKHIRSAVFVTRFGRTRSAVVRNACSRLQAAGMQILGVVVNRARFGSLAYTDGHYYQEYYTQYSEPKNPVRKRS